MVAFRALFWFSVVCTLMPFKHVDLVRGDLEIDQSALMERVVSLPQYCRDNTDVCKSARELVAQAAETGGQLAERLAVALQDRIRES